MSKPKPSKAQQSVIDEIRRYAKEQKERCELEESRKKIRDIMTRMPSKPDSGLTSED